MDREALRHKILGAADRLMDTPIVWHHIAQEDKNTVIAARQAFSEDTPVTDSFLDRILAIYGTL